MQPTCAWSLEIALICALMCVCMCPATEGVNSIVCCYIDVCDWLNKFYGFSLLSIAYVTLAVN